jgi:hypothetical protein
MQSKCFSDCRCSKCFALYIYNVPCDTQKDHTFYCVCPTCLNPNVILKFYPLPSPIKNLNKDILETTYTYSETTYPYSETTYPYSETTYPYSETYYKCS